ncbi:MAG: cytidylate kinase family protein, partial [Planctomycetota bacterium]|nr:cytidylate kinase family protein [Planctomycetota bacterium]
MASALTPTILTVSGLIGSGKTSVCRELSALTGWRVISAGTILRRMAEARGLSVIELNEIAKTDESIDKLIDDQLISLRASREPLIVDSRLAWHFIPNSYKIHLVVDTSIAAERVFRAQRSDESYATPGDAYAANAQRQTIENERFKQYYGIDCEDWRNYDLILDSSTLWPDALAAKMHEAVTGPAPKGSCWLSPGRLKLTGQAAASGPLGLAV